jgi:hypothetical protein
MPNANRTVYLSMELDDAIERIAQKTKKSRNKTFNELLLENPRVKKEMCASAPASQPAPKPAPSLKFRNALGYSRASEKPTLKKRET